METVLIIGAIAFGVIKTLEAYNAIQISHMREEAKLKMMAAEQRHEIELKERKLLGVG